ncbi:uncharacterized protein SPSK_03484 [Sporothrix schenckii 1099-18]|uniref:Amidoligase enzyme n=2 Tax=Sporothrix schenckii TaxID=29908 RepID=U7PR82_SPOS1|nr:uncharacterized protein SPSK_03484 [Sporothrix schenckii 1099-18]ERS97421.1 hypothetical protein HMPREF1624_05588 [Sporothrix schenckii ATCC 58251]KJR81916.1 hypothetical protein SPSK_03484 [Sporothrix schenckii 1099-18]
MPKTSFRFGVELELKLENQQGNMPFKNWSGLAEDVSQRLTEHGIRNHIHGKAAETYKEWFIIREVTIAVDPGSDQYGIELVSPVFRAEEQTWSTNLQIIFNVLHTYYTVHESDTCSTHVHLSTAGTTLTEVNAVCLAEAALYYEHAIDALMPVWRAGGSHWCASNRDSHMFNGSEAAQRTKHPALAKALAAHHTAASLDTYLDIVRACYDSRIFTMDEAMNLRPAKAVRGKAQGKTADLVHGKVFKWNFGSLYKTSGTSKAIHRDGTVEFRQAPGSTRAEDAGAWVALALTFFAGVLSSDGSLPAGTVNGASVAELEALVQRGSQTLGWGNLGGLEEMLKCAQDFQVDEY